MSDIKCPECRTIMVQNPDGTYTCPKCHATYIPSGCKGIFVPASFIGIH